MSRRYGNDNQVCVSLCMHKRGTRRLLCSQKSLILRYEVPKANAFSEQRVNRFAMKSCFAGLLEDSSLKLRMTVLGCRFLVPRKASSDTVGVILERSEGSGRRKCKMQGAKCKINFQLSIFNFPFFVRRLRRLGFAIFTRGNGEIFLEHAIKIGIRGEAEAQGDFLKGKVGMIKKLTADMTTDFVFVCDGRESKELDEASCELTFAQVAHLRKRLDGVILVVVNRKIFRNGADSVVAMLDGMWLVSYRLFH